MGQGLSLRAHHNSETNTLGLPELSLSLPWSQGRTLIVGCSHSLVDVITHTTKDHLERDVALVMGGYHLLPYNADEIAGIARSMREDLGVHRVALAHCTGHLGFKVFREIYDDDSWLAGLGAKNPIPR